MISSIYQILIFTIIPWLAIASAELPAKIKSQPLVSLTFDDAWISQYTEAFPILEHYEMMGTFYILTGALNEPGYMSKEQVLELYNAGHEIGAHTVTHRDLSTLSLEDVENELENSKQFLENLIQDRVSHFAAPFGSASHSVLQLIKKHYKSNRTVSYGFNTKNTLDPYRIKTVVVQASTPLSKIEKVLKEAEEHRSWVIFVYHEIKTGEGQMSPQDFESHIKAIKDRKIKVVTIDQALQEMASTKRESVDL